MKGLRRATVPRRQDDCFGSDLKCFKLSLRFTSCAAFSVPKPSPPPPRARWLQPVRGRHGRIFQLEIQSNGTIPTRGLLICNHVSYVDILVLVSLAPAMSVAEVRVIVVAIGGDYQRLGGTLFALTASGCTYVGEINDDIQAALDDGALVIISSRGHRAGRPGRAAIPSSPALPTMPQQKHPAHRRYRVRWYALPNGGDDQRGRRSSATPFF